MLKAIRGDSGVCPPRALNKAGYMESSIWSSFLRIHYFLGGTSCPIGQYLGRLNNSSKMAFQTSAEKILMNFRAKDIRYKRG